MRHPEWVSDEVLNERRRLVALGYRMLGTVADAEDAVQETYARWFRLSDDERRDVRSPAAWLTRVAGRVCLDMLGSARARREQYVGEWLPEPLPAGQLTDASSSTDPLERVTLDDQVGAALMVVLESLSPAERVAFVLHDVFGMPFAEVAETVGRSPDAVRQLASSARRRIRSAPPAPPANRREAIVLAFAVAANTGDLAGLVAMLDPRVELRADGGGVVSAALKPVRGVDHVSRFLIGVMAKHPDWQLRPLDLVDGPGLALADAHEIYAVISLGLTEGAVTDVWLMRNPDKLTGWR